MSNHTVEVLKGAKALIEEKGWIQGDAHTSKGYCLIGAIGAAACLMADSFGNYGVWNGEAYNAAARIGITSFVDFNDAPGRTKEDVLNLLDAIVYQLETHPND